MGCVGRTIAGCAICGGRVISGGIPARGSTFTGCQRGSAICQVRRRRRFRAISLLSFLLMEAIATPDREQLSSSELAAQLAHEPLMGVSAAARLLGMKAPNFNRDVKPLLPAVPVEGSANVYFRSDVERFAAELRERREAREHRSNGHEPSANDIHQPGPNVENIRSSEQAKAGIAPVPKRV